MSAPPFHATVVAWAGQGVMLTGPSGSGKSDLALRLVDRGWELVGDDYVSLNVEQDQLVARAMPTIAGRIEVRGLGILDHPNRASAPIALGFDLDPATPPDRMPEPDLRQICGVGVSFVSLSAFEPSAPIKVELALKRHGLALEAAPR